MIEKASQLGMTVLFLCASFYLMARRFFEAGVIYYFPTDEDVRDLSKTKVAPLLQRNYFGELVGSTDDVRLKRFADGYLYLRGTQSRVGMKAITGDCVCFDEADDIPDEALEMSKERTHASPRKWERHFSTPTIPGYGVDRSFQSSDRRFWTFTCRDCRKEFDLETTFPESVRARADGTAYRCCPKCGREVALDEGRWIARNPGADFVGFHISQLLSPTIDPAELLKAHRTTTRPARFIRGRLGLPFVVGGGRVTKDQVTALAVGKMRSEVSAEETCVGIDVGRVMHWIAAVPGVKPRVVGMGTENDFDALHQRLLSLKARRWVIDALPETNAAQKLAGRWKGKGHLCYYGSSHKGPPKWSEDEARKFLRVDCNRTDTLDDLLARIREGSIELPRLDGTVEEYAGHVSALIRTEEEDDETGAITNVYVHGGPDHYAHATNYLLLALSGVRGRVQSQLFW